MKKKNLKYIKGLIQVKQEDKKITVVASDETLDRHGDVLPIESWDLSKFKSAPRMLVDHDHQVSSIVGKWENVRIEGKQLLMDANFHGITELSKAVQQMVLEKYLDTVSVGFIMHGPTKDGGQDSFELIETSWVTVPANPSARVQASLKTLIEQAVNAEETAKVKEYMGKDLTEENNDDDVVEPATDDEDEEIEPSILDQQEELKKLGFKICASIQDVKDFQAGYEGGNITTVCDTKFLLKIIGDSEKLSTLTQNGQASFQTRLMKEAFKEAARMINHSLRELNKVD